MAQDLLAAKETIIAANQLDMQQAVDMPKKFTDRLLINEKRIEDMAAGLKTVAQLPDPLPRLIRAGIRLMDCRFCKNAFL